MNRIYDKCYDIDGNKKIIVAPASEKAIIRELLELADWLKEGGCEMVSMESTASYWEPHITSLNPLV